MTLDLNSNELGLRQSQIDLAQKPVLRGDQGPCRTRNSLPPGTPALVAAGRLCMPTHSRRFDFHPLCFCVQVLARRIVGRNSFFKLLHNAGWTSRDLTADFASRKAVFSSEIDAEKARLTQELTDPEAPGDIDLRVICRRGPFCAMTSACCGHPVPCYSWSGREIRVECSEVIAAAAEADSDTDDDSTPEFSREGVQSLLATESDCEQADAIAFRWQIQEAERKRTDDLDHEDAADIQFRWDIEDYEGLA